MKKVLNPVIQTIITILYITSLYVYVHYDQKKTVYCGEVINSGSVQRGRHSEDLYITMRFEELGVRVLEVGPGTYFGTKVGDRLCFELTENQERGDTRPEPAWWQVLLIGCIVVGTFYYLLLLLIATSI